MNPSEIEQAIQINVQHPTRERPTTRITASIRFDAVADILPEELKASRFDLIEHQKSRLKETIMRKIFADQRKQIHDAIMELAMCEPYSSKCSEIRNKLMNLAIRGGAEL